MSFFLGVVGIVLLYAVAGLAAAVLDRHLRLISLSHGAILGTGAYVFAVVSGFTDSFLTAATLGMAAAGLGGILTVLLTTRIVGDDFALATFALQIAWFGLVTTPNPVSGGALGRGGLPSNPLSNSLGTPAALVVTSALLLSSLVWVATRSDRGPFAVAAAIIARSRELASTLAVPEATVRIQLGTLYGVFLGAVGVLMASYFRFIDPMMFAVGTSITILAIGAFAARGAALWVLVGSTLVIGVPQLLRLSGLSPANAGALQLLIGGAVVAIAGAIWLRTPSR